jgi:hypothetical protein
MKMNNSNKRYSTIFAGILVILAISIFLVLFIRCGDNNFYEQDEIQIRCFESEKYHPKRDFGKNRNVPVAKYESWCGVEAETGSVDFSLIWFDYNDDGFDVDDYYFNIDDGSYDMILPNCIIDDLLTNVDVDGDGILDEDELSQWTMTATVTGGYHPLTWGTYLDIYMKKEVECGQYVETFAGRIYIWWELTAPCSGNYIGHFMVENAAPTSDVIKLESSRAPDGMWLGKTYNIEFYSTWAGCGSPDQEFGYILVHKKNIFPESPTLE